MIHLEISLIAKFLFYIESSTSSLSYLDCGHPKDLTKYFFGPKIYLQKDICLLLSLNIFFPWITRNIRFTDISRSKSMTHVTLT
jgi:hypothetical protein